MSSNSALSEVSGCELAFEENPLPPPRREVGDAKRLESAHVGFEVVTPVERDF